jgi:hypothetical protein
MAEYINLVDLAARSGSDSAVGLIEDAVGVAPELGVVPVRTVAGSTFKVTRRTADPAGAFRKFNNGVDSEKSTYVQEVKSLAIFECLMAMDEKAPAIEDRSVGDILTQEAIGAFRGSTRTIGKQFYYGKNADTEGFLGIASQLADDGEVDAGGGTDGTSAYLVQLGIDGVHFVVGDMAPFVQTPWTRQLMEGENSKSLWKWVSNVSALIGLCVGSEYSVYRVKGIKGASSANYLTDARGEELLEKVPTEKQVGLVWMMSPRARRTLQISRSSIGNVAASARSAALAHSPLPVELAGIPIVTSNMIPIDETDLV